MILLYKRSFNMLSFRFVPCTSCLLLVLRLPVRIIRTTLCATSLACSFNTHPWRCAVSDSLVVCVHSQSCNTTHRSREIISCYAAIRNYEYLVCSMDICGCIMHDTAATLSNSPPFPSDPIPGRTRFFGRTHRAGFAIYMHLILYPVSLGGKKNVFRVLLIETTLVGYSDQRYLVPRTYNKT